MSSRSFLYTDNIVFITTINFLYYSTKYFLVFFVLSISDRCRDLINEMSKEIGRVNIYDIYEPCFLNMASSGASFARYECQNTIIIIALGTFSGIGMNVRSHKSLILIAYK